MEAGEGLDVVIVSYRCEGLLRGCLRALAGHSPDRPMAIHVVDNASGDGTAEMVAREFPDVELTVNARNLGFSAANNQVLRRSEARYAVVLNPDTQVRAGTLARLCELMDSRPEVGICGPRLERDDGSLDHAAKRSFPTPLGALAYFAGPGRGARARGRLAQYRAPHLAPDEAGPVDAVNGAFMVISVSALKQVGLFDEGYWMYMEDLDLCHRFAQAGWTTWYEPSATALHVKGGSAGEHRSLRLNRAFHYGMYRFYRKHYAPDRGPLVNLVVYCGIALKLAVSVAGDAIRRSLTRLSGAGTRP
jgi:N-acetylglucosaminyl-diphospho-decaprenol L-rhamnosyltransferase